MGYLFNPQTGQRCELEKGLGCGKALAESGSWIAIDQWGNPAYHTGLQGLQTHNLYGNCGDVCKCGCNNARMCKLCTVARGYTW
jgi:hypothetical protein